MHAIFGTDGIRSVVNEYPMQIDVILKIALFMGARVAEMREAKTIVIGRDTRESCAAFESALVSGFLLNGINVVLLGVVPTSFVSFFTADNEAQFGIMITASHNDSSYNGLKIFSSDGMKISDAVQNEIEVSLYDGGFNVKSIALSRLGKIRYVENVIQKYSDFILNSTRELLNGIDISKYKILVDVANGAAFEACKMVFSNIKSDVTLFNDLPTGFNINDNCGAVYPESLALKVKELGADIGICLDGDADRIVVIDEEGDILNGDYVLATIARLCMQDKTLKTDVIVTTIMSNMGFEKYINSLGLRVVRTKVGDRYVCESMMRFGANLGGEQSGHIILSDYSKVGDGILVAVKFICFLKMNNMKVSDIKKMFTQFPQKILNIPFHRNGDKIMESVEELISIMKVDSGRISDNTRIIVRKSGTEPKIRVMVEAEDVGEAEYILSEVEALTEFDDE